MEYRRSSSGQDGSGYQEKLKTKTVSEGYFDEELTFSPEEMQPIEVAEALESDLIMGKTAKQVKKARRLFGVNE